MKETIHYQLKKPEYSDASDMVALNPNWDVTDAMLKALNDSKSLTEEHLANAISHITGNERNNWNSKAEGTHNHNTVYAPIGHSSNVDVHVNLSQKNAWNSKAEGSHNHSASEINSGILSPSRGGTGQSSLQASRNAMGLGNTTGALPLGNGGTGATSASGARSNLGITPGNIGAESAFSVLSIGKGGTGSSSAFWARQNLDVAVSNCTDGNGVGLLTPFQNEPYMLMAIDFSTPSSYFFIVGYRYSDGTLRQKVVSSNGIYVGATNSMGTVAVTPANPAYVRQFAIGVG